MKLKKVGFFESLPGAERSSFIRTLVSAEKPREKQQILKYLRSGHQLFVMPAFAFDHLHDKARLIGTLEVLTDGEWAWTSDVIYYYDYYNIALPDSFLLRMRHFGWKVPHVHDLSSLRV